MFSEADHEFMQRAQRLAQRAVGKTEPNPRVGCVIVKNGDVIGEGFTQPAGDAHAEVVALRQAKSNVAGELKGATVYATLEPCSHIGKTPPCADALIKARVAKVIYAAGDPNPEVNGKGAKRLRDTGIEVLSELLSDQTIALNKGFFQRMQTGLPWVTVKTAATLDGRTAAANGESKWITSSAARADVHKYRKRSSCILTGVETVLADDPKLNARTEDEVYLPAIAIMDTRLRTPADAALLETGAKVFIFTCSDNRQNANALTQAGAQVIVLEGERPDVEAVLRYLAKQGVNEVWTEAGASLCGSIIESGCANELVYYLAPVLLGNSARGLFELPALQSLEQKINLAVSDVRQLAGDLRITATIINS